MAIKSYVYDGTEVVKTGRVAEKQLPHIGPPNSRTTPNRVISLIEITPIEEEFGWKKWVNPDQLFEIIDSK